MKNNSLTIKGRADSFKFAFRGIATLISSQQNAWIHALATVVVVVLGVVCSLTRFEWCWIILAAASVWATEAVNTALEFLTDLASPEFHPLAAKTKDVAAGAVLITAIGAALIGGLIFIPHLLSF